MCQGLSVSRLLALSVVLAACNAGVAPPGPPAPPAPEGTGGARPPSGTGGAPAPGGTGGVPPSPGGSGGSPGSGGAPGNGQPDAGRPDSGRPDSGRPRPDASAPDAASSSDAGTPPSSELDQRCTVPTTFTNKGEGTQGATIFNASIPDPVAASQAHARAICKILYRKVEEVKNVRRQSLTIEPHEIIAFAAGDEITFSTDYIADFARGKSKAAIDAELHGVLVHEGTHVWQYTNGGGALVEAMADYVRYKAGFYTLARRSRGGSWRDPYTTGGFFIAWVEEKYDPDYGYKLNMGMKNRGFSYPQFVQQTIGKDIDTLWAEYQAAIR